MKHSPNLTPFERALDGSLKHGFINQQDYPVNLYAPKIVMNNPKVGQHVLTDLQEALSKCQSFCFSVAFITQTGIGMLKTQFLSLAERGGSGKILISPYLDFNDPLAMKELLKLKNVEVRLTPPDKKMHAKLYYFNQPDQQVIIMGSSNLTENALKVNYEWNVKLTASQNGDYILQTMEEYDEIWQASQPLTLDVIEAYQKQRQAPLFRASYTLPSPNIDSQTTQDFLEDPLVDFRTDQSAVITPNVMQKEALAAIDNLRQSGKDKALIISATGTGKTYLAAFDVRHYQPKKMLFIVHREQILNQALADFQKVIGFSDQDGVIYRSGMDLSPYHYVFATIQSLSRDENLSGLAEDLFDYILIDEVHKAGADSYHKVIDHFEPNFLLGMTATPERTDGQNIYELFDYHVAYEIRLQQALDADLLCPFLYYGVTDIALDGHLVSEKTSFSDLTSQARLKHLIEKITYYGHSGENVKGLIFCSRNDEAAELSKQLNDYGYRTRSLSGKDPQHVREQTIDDLENGRLDYILTVDIFNEGIDIPSINQVVMLRHTLSSIIFIQQLGRGLRKHESKAFVTVIDFIGNYKNNYLIPVALFGDQSMNKDNFRNKLINKNHINGITTINFEEVAQQQIFQSIKNTSLSTLKILKEAFSEVQNRIGKTPQLSDFIKQNSIDPMAFFANPAFKHYGNVLDKFDPAHSKDTNHYEGSILTMMTSELLNGKRPHELIILKLLFTKKRPVTLAEVNRALEDISATTNPNVLRSAKRVLNYDFFKDGDAKKYGSEFIVYHNNTFAFTQASQELLTNDDFLVLALDIIETGLIKSRDYPSGYQPSGLTISQKYSRKDACRLLLWDKDESSTMYGYKSKFNTCPIFVTYHKSNDISESTQYADAFINEHLFHWYTRSNRTLKSNEVKEIVYHKDHHIDLHLFVKKEDGEGSDFYYLGTVDTDDASVEEKTMAHVGSQEPVVTMNFNLQHAVPYTLYRYLIDNQEES